MDRPPIGSGACCPPSVSGITYLQVGNPGHTVGMLNLDTVFKQLYAMERKPEEVSDTEIVGMARKFNYIGYKPQIEKDYAVALRKAYAAYYAQQEKES